MKFLILFLFLFLRFLLMFLGHTDMLYQGNVQNSYALGQLYVVGSI